jgi:hypothetical protein
MLISAIYTKLFTASVIILTRLARGCMKHIIYFIIHYSAFADGGNDFVLIDDCSVF